MGGMNQGLWHPLQTGGDISKLHYVGIKIFGDYTLLLRGSDYLAILVERCAIKATIAILVEQCAILDESTLTGDGMEEKRT